MFYMENVGAALFSRNSKLFPGSQEVSVVGKLFAGY